MKVELFSFLRQAAGTSEINIQARDVRALLELLSDVYGEEFKKLILETDVTLKEGVNVLVNGRNILFLEGLETVLNPEDTVTLIPPAAGG